MINSGIHHTAILQTSSPLQVQQFCNPQVLYTSPTIAMAQRTCMLTGLQKKQNIRIDQHLINDK
jgi:hypothetical protein